MNKKRFLSMLLMAALVIQIFPASAGAATVKQDVTLEGEIDVVNPIYDIIIPTDLKFQVDSFGIFSEDPTSIISTGYAIVNRSPMAVQVDITASLQSASSSALTFKDTVADVSTEDPANTDAELYFELKPSVTAPIATTATFNYTAVTPGSVNITGPAVGTTIGWNVSPSALTYVTGQAIDTTTGNSVSFVMAKSPNAVKAATEGEITYQAGNPASDDAIAFKFDGALNPYAQWGEGDLANFKVVAKFTFNALTVKGYDKVKTDLSDAKGHGYLGAGAGGVMKLADSSFNQAAPGPVSIPLKFPSGATSVSGFSVRLDGGLANFTADYWVVQNGNLMLAKATPFLNNNAKGVYTLVVTFDNGKIAESKLTLY